MNYDVIIIGAGPGGYVSAVRASQLGLKTAVIDKEYLGGVCLNVGCIPSKSLLKNAAVADILRHGGKDFGFKVENVTLDYAAAVRRSRQVSERLTKGVSFLMKKNKVDVLMGVATLKSKTEVEVTPNDGGAKQTHTAKHVIIATGARVAPPGAFNVDGKTVVTYKEAIVQDRLPASAVIIGGGAIGCEFGTIWSAYGSKVTIIEMLPTLLPREDEELGTELAKQFTRHGIGVKTGTKVDKIEKTDAGVKVTVTGPAGTEVLEAEQALVAIGFRPNSEGLGLEALGVAVEKGFIQVDDRMATNVAGLWAIGDVTGKTGWAHTASAQGIAAAEAIAGHHAPALQYEFMPSAVYCHPQVASFGLTEARAKERGYEVKVVRFPFQANGKALGLNEYAGFVKIVTDAKYGEVLGAHMIGPEVTELLGELTLAHGAELTIEEIARNVHAHPSLSEAIMDAAHGAVGGYITI